MVGQPGAAHAAEEEQEQPPKIFPGRATASNLTKSLCNFVREALRDPHEVEALRDPHEVTEGLCEEPSSHLTDLLDTTSPFKLLQLEKHDLDCLDHQSHTHKTKFLLKLSGDLLQRELVVADPRQRPLQLLQHPPPPPTTTTTTTRSPLRTPFSLRRDNPRPPPVWNYSRW
ncbi:hypothetical protein PCANC_06549 [Puccinia coronata f. sp. avenae]|uniref:Uncharacterized protein n=1 Tax=Puccinia coronata f. sp. avenae TaxID=200324 RepID=A0A2N5VAG1_9BASI|nr:hypothetical protein PCANC_06549 [Puccinia coronata f. sp. avenae]